MEGRRRLKGTWLGKFVAVNMIMSTSESLKSCTEIFKKIYDVICRCFTAKWDTNIVTKKFIQGCFLFLSLEAMNNFDMPNCFRFYPLIIRNKLVKKQKHILV